MVRGSTLLTSLLMSFALAGCAAFSDGGAASCLSDSELRDIEDAMDDFENEPFGERTITIVVDGRMDGENADATFAIDVDDEAVRASSADGEFRISGTEYSLEDLSDDPDALTGYGRNHDPGALYEAFLEGMNEEDEDDIEFLDDVQFEDFDVSCAELSGEDVVVLEYEDEDRSLRMTLEANGDNLPVQVVVQDSISDDNFRMSISYDQPTINIDRSLPRLPVTIVFESTYAVVNERGGTYEILEIGSDSEWCPISDMTMQLVDAGDGTVYIEQPLSVGYHDWADGDGYWFDDVDNNRLVSAGDEITYDFGPGLYLAVFDDWAGTSVDVVNV